MKGDIKYVYDTAGKFKFKKFFAYSGNKDNGASVVITSRQVLITPNIYNYEGYHVATQATMIEAIYNQICSNDCELYRFRTEAIRMDLVSERNGKFIMIHFPQEITQEQIDLLQAFQNTYGKIVERISRRYVSKFPNNDPIVLCAYGGGDYYSHSFEDALKYARNSIPKKEIDTPEENIIGRVISPDGLTLCNGKYPITLKELTGRILEKQSITIEDVKGAFQSILTRFRRNRRKIN